MNTKESKFTGYFLISSTISKSFWPIASVLIVKFIGHDITLILQAFAGKQTLADINIGVLGNIKISIGLSIAFGLSGFGYGYYQRRMLKNATKKYSKDLDFYEKQFDKHKNSSNLSEDGSTANGDKHVF